MILNIIAGTPWWVWSIFAYLIFIGLKARHTQTIYLPVLFIIPIIFTALKLYALGTAGFLSYALWLIPGSVVGCLMTLHTRATFHRHNLALTIPGSWQTFSLLMLLFSIRYVFGYLHAVHPAHIASYAWLELTLHATFSGIFWGRALCYTYRYYRA